MTVAAAADDGHGPKYGCTYQNCGVDAAPDCPFVKDSSRPEASPPDTCKHEWRESLRLDLLTFYCIYCLAIRTLKLRNGIITSATPVSSGSGAHLTSYLSTAA